MSYQLLASTASSTAVTLGSGAALIGFVALGIAWLVFFLAALVGILRSPNYPVIGKIIWCLIALMLPLLGPIAWFAFGRKGTM